MRFCPTMRKSRSRCCEPDKRPVSAVADHIEFRDVVLVEVKEESGIDIFMMFDPGHTLAERILAEQFGYLTRLKGARRLTISASSGRSRSLGLLLRRADIDETGNALVRGQAERLANARDYRRTIR